jgi:hypothetical protein
MNRVATWRLMCGMERLTVLTERAGLGDNTFM